MALGKTVNLVKTKTNNKTETIVNRTVEAVVVNNQLVPDIRQENPGVVTLDFRK